MKKNNSLKIGSKIVEQGEVYRVYKITRTKVDEKVQRIIHYRHFFKRTKDDSLNFSIPECSIEYPDIRCPVSRGEIGEVFEILQKWATEGVEIDIDQAKSDICENDILKTARVLKGCFKERVEKGQAFTSSKKTLLDTAINRVIEEVALVSNLSLDEARKKITSTLEDSSV